MMRALLAIILCLCAAATAYEPARVNGDCCMWMQETISYSIDVPASIGLKVKRGVEASASRWMAALTYQRLFRFTKDRAGAEIRVVAASMGGLYAAYTTTHCDIWGRILRATITINLDYPLADYTALMLHEFGHALGLAHNNRLSCMNPALWAYCRWPMTDDIRGIRWLYGL